MRKRRLENGGEYDEFMSGDEEESISIPETKRRRVDQETVENGTKNKIRIENKKTIIKINQE